MYNLNGKQVNYQKFYDNAREFTPAQVVEAAEDAVDNWDWEAESDGPEMKQFLEGWDESFVRDTFADDDGIVRIEYKDIWEMLDEFARSSLASYRANKAYWG